MAKYKIIGLPKQIEEYFELELTPEEIEEYARGGFIVEDISVPSLSHAQEGGEPKRKKKSKKVDPFVTSNPKEYAFRKAAYDDSLNLYNKSKKQLSQIKLKEWDTPVYLKKGVSPKLILQPEYNFVNYHRYNTTGRFDGNMNPNNVFPPPKIKQKIMPIGGIGVNSGNSMGGWYDIYKKPVQSVLFKEETKPTKKTDSPIVKEQVTYVNPPVEERIPIEQPQPPILPTSPITLPGPGTDVMPVYDIDELPMYATPDGGAEWIGDIEKYVDWDGNRVPYRLPRFRKPGHGGDLIRRGKQRYIPFPSIESRYQAQIVPEEEYQDGGEPKKKKRKTDDHGRYRSEDGNVRTPITPEMQAVMPPDEWGQYIQDVPEVYTTITKEQQQERNSQRNMEFLQNIRAGMARNNPHLYLPDGTLRPQAVQAADWFWQLGAMGPAGLEGLGALAAKQIPRTGLTVGTIANTAAGIHGATQVPQRIQDWQDVAEGKKDWREATAESLMTGLELYGGLSELRALKGIPRELPGSPNSFSIFPRKPIPLSDRSLEFGKASKTVGGNQIPDNRWLPKPEPNPEYEWFNPENKKLYDEFTASLEEQAKRSQELSDFDAAAAMDKINASKLGPGAFEKLIMGDDLLWKIDDFADTPRIPYTRKDLYREGNKLFPKVEYKPMDPITREQINVLNNIERSTNMLNEAEQAILDIKALRTEMDPREFVRQFRYELIDPKTGKPFSPTQIKMASPKQISSWRKQIERKLLNPIYTEIQLQGLLPKVKASDFKYYSNKEGGQINSSKNSKLSKFIS